MIQEKKVFETPNFGGEGVLHFDIEKDAVNYVAFYALEEIRNNYPNNGIRGPIKKAELLYNSIKLLNAKSPEMLECLIEAVSKVAFEGFQEFKDITPESPKGYNPATAC